MIDNYIQSLNKRVSKVAKMNFGMTNQKTVILWTDKRQHVGTEKDPIVLYSILNRRPVEKKTVKNVFKGIFNFVGLFIDPTQPYWALLIYLVITKLTCKNK